MSTSNSNIRNIVTNNIGRVFIQRANSVLGCCPEYLGCVGMTGVTQGRDESVTIKCLSPTQSGRYDVIDKIPGELQEITFDLTTHLGLHGQSLLRGLFQENCASTIHVHFGTCSNPQDFREFNKAIVLDNVLFNSYSTSDLITLESGNIAAVEETASAEAETMYEYFAEKSFDLVASIGDTDPVDIHLVGGGCSDVCVFCCDCTVQDCPQNFYTIPQDGVYVATFNDGDTVYTIEDSGVIKAWNYELITDGNLACSVATTLCLNDGETVISAAYSATDDIILVGTSDGRLLSYNTNNGTEVIEYTFTGETATNIVANDCGYLVGTSVNNIYYSSNREVWAGPTNTGAGAIEAMWLYSTTSWLLSMSSGAIYYTNTSGSTYSSKQYPKILGDNIKQFEQSNHSILHAVSDAYFYQSFDAGCSWQALDLSKYFTTLFSLVVCPTDPFIVYVSGLSADGTQIHIVKINFGV